jgi:hypothetical protein
MRPRAHRLAVALLFCAARGLFGSGEQPDHLMPGRHETGESAEYRRLIYKHLLITPAQFGRMIYEPGWDPPEWAVSVYGTGKLGGNDYRSYHITVTRVLSSGWVSSIWTSLPSNNEERRQKTIRTSRKDVEIDRELAMSVQRAWATMLSRTRPEEERFLFTDAPTVEFILESRRGEITPPRKGLTIEMYDIGTALANLSDMPPEKRAAAQKKMIRRLDAFERKARKA